MRSSFTGVAIGLLIALPAAGQDASTTALEAFRSDTTAHLSELCGMPEDDELYAEARQFCFGYIAGTGDFYRESFRAGGIAEVACPGHEITREDVRAAFVAWASAHEEMASEGALDGLMRAAAAEWPCPQ